MPTLEELLQRELVRQTPPPDDTLLSVLRIQRGRRTIRRRLGSAVLAVTVVVSSVGGFVFLQRVFRGEPRIPVPQAQLPANGAIVFERSAPGDHGGSQLWLAMPGDAQERQLTFGDVYDRWPAWSPDGNLIAFSRWDRGSDEIRLALLDLATGSMAMPSQPDFAVARPDWSPDGSRIAFAGVRGETPQSGIYIVNADGTGLRLITDPSLFAPDNPEWSPDGSTIAFSGNLDSSRFSWDVYLIGTDGSNLRNVTNTPNEERSELVIGWLPNGNLLVRDVPSTLASGPGLPVQTERWLEMTVGGNIARVVFEGPANGSERRQEPSLSPDGRFVLFDSADARDNSVRYMEIDTGAVTLVAPGHTPAWQPLPASATPPQEPESATRLTGVPFPICRPMSIPGDFGGGLTTAWVFEEERVAGAGCGADTEGFQHVGVGTESDVVAFTDRNIEGNTGRWPFATPDIDGDGLDEIAIGIDGARAKGQVSFILFAVQLEHGGGRVVPITLDCGPTCEPFPWIDADLEGTVGATCGSLNDHEGPRGLIRWSAEGTSPETGQLRIEATLWLLAGERLVSTEPPLLFDSADPMSHPGDLCGSPTFWPEDFPNYRFEKLIRP